MSDYQFPELPGLEETWRAAYHALQRSIPRDRMLVTEQDLHISEVISLFPGVLREAELAAAAELGPPVSWEGPPRGGDWDLVLAGTCFDADAREADPGPATLADSAFQGPSGRWGDGALGRAGTVYQRECRWGSAPGEAGFWLLMLAPVHAAGPVDGPMFYGGNLVGFVILYDRDGDGRHESVGHIWTARAWRRRGIAGRLLHEARARFQFTTIEGPYTAPGAAFIMAASDDHGALARTRVTTAGTAAFPGARASTVAGASSGTLR